MVTLLSKSSPKARLAQATRLWLARTAIVPQKKIMSWIDSAPEPYVKWILFAKWVMSLGVPGHKDRARHINFLRKQDRQLCRPFVSELFRRSSVFCCLKIRLVWKEEEDRKFLFWLDMTVTCGTLSATCHRGVHLRPYWKCCLTFADKLRRPLPSPLCVVRLHPLHGEQSTRLKLYRAVR